MKFILNINQIILVCPKSFFFAILKHTDVEIKFGKRQGKVCLYLMFSCKIRQ